MTAIQNTKGTKQKKNRKAIEEESKKVKLNTSESIINRLRWDSSLPSQDFVIGYLDRFLGIMESTLETHEFSEIPLHRIYYFKYNGQKVWDRDSRVDNISNGAIYSMIVQ
ncbi:hypothetical protein AKO1_011535 [Acrasis kona]|uniref:MJ1316 RNA cyclic group end recognition domain-containing protein n=1 Tax=Acrasis kona TaxID=1008807 RepID=A0AAW2Z1B1_9EUKA